jgi:chromosome partitioning protein
MKIKIGIYNNKGGVGKTTTVINLAYLYAKMGMKILVVDCDTQRNLHDFFKLKTPPNGIKYTAENLLAGRFEHSRYENIFLDLWESYSDNIETGDIFDIEIFDLPPKTDEQTREILDQCDYIFVPMKLDKFSVTGLRNVKKEIANSNAKFRGAFICNYQRRSTAVNEMLRFVQENMGENLLSTIIPASLAIGNSFNYDLTATEYANNSATIKLADLAEEILERMGGVNNG